MSDDSSHSESSRGRRVIEAVRRRLQRVEIETHLIRADLAQFEPGQEAGIAEALRGELGLEDIEAPTGDLDMAAPVESAATTGSSVVLPTRSKLATDAAPSLVDRVDLSPRRRRVVNEDAAAADLSAIPLRIGGEGEQTQRKSLIT
jgi:hypothetical protein